MEQRIEELLVPKLSPDIEVTHFDKDSYLIKQNAFDYRLKATLATMELINLVDGRRNITEIAEALSSKLKKAIPVSTVYHTLTTGSLVECGIIQTDKVITPKKDVDYIWAKITIFKPNQIGWITALFSNLFKPALFISLGSIALAYLITVIFLFSDPGSIFNRFIKPENILIFYCIVLISVFFHEMGHVSACRKFGAKYGSIGFGMYLIFPVFYADVTDAWRLSRLQRFIVDLAGIYMELLVYIGISILFFITRDSFYLQLILLRLLGSLTNLNPFLRYDGYWALSDLTNTPNLRANSYKKFKATVGWMINSSSGTPLVSGKDYFLAFYGAISWTFIAIFLIVLIFFNSSSILYFPVRFYEFIVRIFSIGITIEVLKVTLLSFSVPILFYFMLFRWTYFKFKPIRIKKEF